MNQIARNTVNTPLIEIRDLWRHYPAGEDRIAVLKGVNLTIERGEMVAIIGASGSGKSTLMNILGCLDRPTGGEYRVNGRLTGDLEPDELAALRREYFGFIFQRYHLLSDLSALGNVEVPSIYAGFDAETRRDRAMDILTRVGLGDRIHHRPSQLSGGQQQRVSIARALMNGGDVILADEPTGALDSQSGAQTLELLRNLHRDGHTVILVTHDHDVAAHAQRIIEIRDGEIIRDERQTQAFVERAASKKAENYTHRASRIRAEIDRFTEAFKMALVAMNAHRLRTFLTMLGIIIGIASVVSVVALGQGSQDRILADISSIATNTIDVNRGKDFGDRDASQIRTLTAADADILATQYYVDSVTPKVSSTVTLRYGNIEVDAAVAGVGTDYYRVRGYEMADGIWFNSLAVDKRSQDAVIDDNTREKLFPNGEDPLGQVIFLGTVPVRIIGVTAPKDSTFGNNDSLNIWVPYTTALTRILGQNYLSSITVRIDDAVQTALAQQNIETLLTQRHGVKDFFTINTDTIRETIEKTTSTMTLLISSIAVISLIVGGIGVMNIMLVSVTERTGEIGVRMAVGARQSDILRQFLIEAVLVCILGGALGVLTALGIGVLFDAMGSSFSMVYSTTSIVAAFACATLIGIAFGFLPARNAARLDPVDALSRD
ncbi:macrolide transport system ATP-binding/permease protein [Thalassospira sp. MBR-102]|jgi:macrolide transport system ATP-binding/permease protein|uniref:MacB family efflux pump subunit n=2 Tax=Thalassospiraceae TaxID=2844866 RepID=UPI0008DD1FD5|nr:MULTISPECIES: MacB family efflux pump subunit [Thalassospira]MAB33034.1 MacB family efflux pump subunit [Thalassospira sp.]MDM7978388.1 MacB family efflux pump subunit [Thalassospira xiamenensis]OHZ03121.1 macrolide ABC transporter permease/ATP-binding protein MacB [Thalassospira sp. MIT1004]